jgi:hypothetical protein
MESFSCVSFQKWKDFRMPKQKSNPTGRVSIDLFTDKKELDQTAKNAGTTGTNLARILIRDGLAKLASGEYKITTPSLASLEGNA